MKPYELITHVNDKPISNVKEFEQQVSGATGELSFSVRRPTTGKVVKIRLDKADTQPASGPAPASPPLRPGLPLPEIEP
jgi:S1-C subfamily serine protease